MSLCVVGICSLVGFTTRRDGRSKTLEKCAHLHSCGFEERLTHRLSLSRAPPPLLSLSQELSYSLGDIAQGEDGGGMPTLPAVLALPSVVQHKDKVRPDAHTHTPRFRFP